MQFTRFKKAGESCIVFSRHVLESDFVLTLFYNLESLCDVVF